MATATVPNPLIERLAQVEGKAEIVGGEIVEIEMTGYKPGYAADEIYASLREHVRSGRAGIAVADGKGFLCDLPNRQSFSPDAAFYDGPLPEAMEFFPQAPVFAVEVRSENDYGVRAERLMAQKRADYFAAGTLVVWDVDLQDEEVVAKYTAAAPLRPQIFKRGEVADAEPAVPGWKMATASLFAPQTNS
jgi:Uma2 family endonuclease